MLGNFLAVLDRSLFWLELRQLQRLSGQLQFSTREMFIRAAWIVLNYWILAALVFGICSVIFFATNSTIPLTIGGVIVAIMTLSFAEYRNPDSFLLDDLRRFLGISLRNRVGTHANGIAIVKTALDSIERKYRRFKRVIFASHFMLAISAILLALLVEARG
ncbi:MAG: hypothetical protein ACLQME_05770 [Alphaproteobacteria bacterium]